MNRILDKNIRVLEDLRTGYSHNSITKAPSLRNHDFGRYKGVGETMLSSPSMWHVPTQIPSMGVHRLHCARSVERGLQQDQLSGLRSGGRTRQHRRPDSSREIAVEFLIGTDASDRRNPFWLYIDRVPFE
jgi:hypothetical protein